MTKFIITNKRDIDRCWKNEKLTADTLEEAKSLAEEHELLHVYELDFADDSGDLISIRECYLF